MIPQLAASIGPKFNRFPCYVQPKLNGVRALYQNGNFQSRDEKLWHRHVLQHLRHELATMEAARLLDPSLILDGELYVHDWRLARINGAVAVNRKEPSEDTGKVEFHVFDVVDPSKSFTDRWFTFYHTVSAADLQHIRVVPTGRVENRVEMQGVFELYVSQGYEGIMLRPDGPYESGVTPHGTRKNSKFLWKYKSWEDGEWECCGVTQGEGKANIGIGALVLRMPGLEINGMTQNYSTFSVGTGFTDAERIFYAGNPPIGKLVKVRYPYLSADGIPQCPSFLCVL